MKKEMKVDIIIPVYKPGYRFIEILKNLCEQTFQVNKIILINTDKVFFDETSYLIDSRIEVHHITHEEFDHAATRNMAIRMSDADYVLLMTMDAFPADNRLIEKLVGGFKDGVAVSYARQLPLTDCRIQERYTREYNYPPVSKMKSKEDISEMGIKTFFCSDVCAMYDRSVYLKTGGFVNRAIFNEDMIYAAKVIGKGYSIFYNAEAEVYHSHNYTARQQFHRNFDLGVSQAEHPEIFEKIHSESEGIKLVKSTASYIIKHGKWYCIPYLFISSAYKYAGYKLGKRYKKLSTKFIMACTLNKNYWINNIRKEK